MSVPPCGRAGHSAQNTPDECLGLDPREFTVCHCARGKLTVPPLEPGEIPTASVILRVAVSDLSSKSRSPARELS